LQEIDNKGYICPQCKASYTPLDVDKIMDFARGIFVCEICQAELIENEDAESVQGSKDRMMRFNHQMRFIREGLQKSESMKLPQFDVAAWVKQHAQQELEQRQKANGGAGYDGAVNGPGAGLKVAGADSNGKRDEGIGIMMVMEGDGEDEDKRRREREKEAELKRQQNALPAWHLKSTITDDLTALGVKEAARQQSAVDQGLGGGDESLRGLGIAGVHKHGTSATISMHTSNGLGHAKSEIVTAASNEAELLYEQYYASLAATPNPGSAPTSTMPTPSGTQPSDYGLDLDEEEDRKPSIKMLESLSEYRKRSRSIEDVGSAPKTPKIAKTDSNSSVAGLANGFSDHLPAQFATPEFVAPVEPEPHMYAQPPADDPLVYGMSALTLIDLMEIHLFCYSQRKPQGFLAGDG
jgi:transcription initiation factor TFIIE subunit alpha